MKNTNPIFTLKNFRSFGEEGSNFELAPITVLTGCNSAGKSSMAKAIMLMSKLPQSRNTCFPSLGLYSKELGLGQFDKVLHKDSQNNEIELTYKVWSNYLQELVIVRRYFKALKPDVLNDGHMTRYSVEKVDGTIFYEEDVNKCRGMKDWTDAQRESVKRNFDNFCIVAEYVLLKRNIQILNRREFKTDEAEFKKEYNKKCNEYSLRLSEIQSTLKKRGIDSVDSYKFEDLCSWREWCKKRESEIEIDRSWLARKKNTENEINEFMNQWHHEGEVLEYYMELVLNEVYHPWFLKNVKYIDSQSASIRRIYSIDDGNKMSNALRLLNDFQVSDQIFGVYVKGHIPGGFMNKWVKEFGIGDRVVVSGDGEGGIKVYLKDGEQKRLLADEGYGVTQIVSLLLTIDNAIRSEPESEIPLKDGCPLPKNSLWTIPPQVICVEEPENHLHPKYQSLLAKMFVEAYQKYNIHFIIETHSEYLIRKLQVMVADKECTLTPNDVSINYVEKDENGVSTNRKIEVKEDGRLAESFGKGFYDEASDLSMELYRFKARLQ